MIDAPAAPPDRPADLAPRSLVVVDPALLADRELAPVAKILILAVRSLVGCDGACSPSDADIADRMGLREPASRNTRRHVQALVLDLETAGRLRRLMGPNGKRVGFDLASLEGKAGAGQGDAIHGSHDAGDDAIPHSHHPASGAGDPACGDDLAPAGDDYEPMPEPRRLDAAELATFGQLASESRLSRALADRYRVARFLLRRMYPDVDDPPFTVPAVSDTLGTAWRHGTGQLRRREMQVAEALKAAGVALARVPGFASR